MCGAQAMTDPKPGVPEKAKRILVLAAPATLALWFAIFLS